MFKVCWSFLALLLVSLNLPQAFGHPKAAILNGGLPRWISEGHPTESGTPQSIKVSHPYTCRDQADLNLLLSQRTSYPEPELDGKLIRSMPEAMSRCTGPHGDVDRL